MNATRSENGYTLIESLVALLLISIVSTTFYSVMFSGVRGSEKAREVTRVTEEARSGLNRMVRDTREADLLSSISATSYNVRIDFNGDGAYENPNADGDFEDLTFSYNAISETISLNGETLVAGVDQIGTNPVFSYNSSYLEYDWDGDGVTTLAELEAAPSHGITTVTAGNETDFLTGVTFEFEIASGDSNEQFIAEAQLRNRR